MLIEGIIQSFSGPIFPNPVAGQVYFGHTVQQSGSSIATMLIIQKGPNL